MKCEGVQNRLLALPDVARVPAELRDHLGGCAACQAFVAAVGRLDALLVAIPVPSSEERKAAFIDSLTEAGPIIKRVPVVPRRDSAVNLSAVLAKSGQWKYLAGLAAALLVAVGAWWATRGDKPEVAEAAGPRHELTKREVARTAALAKPTTTPRERAAIWADSAADHWAEAKALHKYASDDDMAAIARDFDKAARGGVLKQARQLDHLLPDQRKTVLADLAARMSAAETEATHLIQEAPPQSKASLRQIADSAKAVRTALQSPDGKGA